MPRPRPCKIDRPNSFLPGMFKMTPAGVKALAGWIGKPFLASFHLNRRYKLVWPWAFLLVFGSLISLMPPPRSGMPPRFDVTIFALEMMLLVGCAFAKWWPHPVLFLVDSVWFSWVAVNLTLGIVHGQSKGWLILVALMVWMAVIGRHRAQRERLQLLHRPLGSRRAGVTPATRHRAGIDPSHSRIRRAVHSDPSVRTQGGGLLSTHRLETASISVGAGVRRFCSVTGFLPSHSRNSKPPTNVPSDFALVKLTEFFVQLRRERRQV